MNTKFIRQDSAQKFYTTPENDKLQEISKDINSNLSNLYKDEIDEWVESFDVMLKNSGSEQAKRVISQLLERAREKSISIPVLTSTDYINTIPSELEPYFPGNEGIERKYRSWIRWNAAIMVHRAQRSDIGVGGHISTYASSASLYEVGFNHFFRGKSHPGGGDQIFIQGHASPGIYARAFLEGRLTKNQMDGFRQERSHLYGGLPSYPHPRLMPKFWEFPTVSMGLGPANAIYQARFNHYLHDRKIKDTSSQHVWAIIGDGEMDEPESKGLIQVASNEALDNLTFIINCNLQRLDGPVRGNGKIIQELESFFRGAGWNVIKVIWGREWDKLLKNDYSGALVELMNKTPDGDYQTYKANSGAYIRENFFGLNSFTKELVKTMSDYEIWNLKRGGHDYQKIYSAYSAAIKHKGQPTVILAKTIKGYSLGSNFESRNATHQMKKLPLKDLKNFRDLMQIPISNARLEKTPDLPPYYHPGLENSAIRYMINQRNKLGGFLPSRRNEFTSLVLPDKNLYKTLKKVSKNQAVATTMATVRVFKELLRDTNIGKRIVPIIPDEARTFGMDSWFPNMKIYNHNGQMYTSVDSLLMLAYKESKSGQILHEGINETGAVASFTAAGTSYSTHNEPMIPIYIFYSMFGFQRTGDGLWAAADQMSKGFLLGATAGKTTLVGEGLQHADGHSLLLASTNPAVIAYDPAFAYEIVYIIENGLLRMYGNKSENIFFYITIYNEPHIQPDEPLDLDAESLLKGMYLYREAYFKHTYSVQIAASGVAMYEALRAADILSEDWDVSTSIWSVTSWGELNREGIEIERKRLHYPEKNHPTPHVTKLFLNNLDPIIAVSDWIKAVPEQIRPWIPNTYITLGTDGFGFSDTRPAARRYFNTDAESIVVAALRGLAQDGKIDYSIVESAAKRYKLDKIII